MSERKSSNVSMIIIFVVIIIIAVALAVLMYYKVRDLSAEVKVKDEELATLQEEKHELQTKLNNIQDIIGGVTNSINDELTTTTPSADTNSIYDGTNTTGSTSATETKIQNAAKEYVEAWNNGDWKTVEKYTKDAEKNYKKYNITNVQIADYNDLKTNADGAYYYTTTCNINYMGATNIKDIGAGNYLLLSEKDGKITIEPFVSGI